MSKITCSKVKKKLDQNEDSRLKNQIPVFCLVAGLENKVRNHHVQVYLLFPV